MSSGTPSATLYRLPKQYRQRGDGAGQLLLRECGDVLCANDRPRGTAVLANTSNAAVEQFGASRAPTMGWPEHGYDGAAE